jgi:IS5 family transposase
MNDTNNITNAELEEIVTKITSEGNIAPVAAILKNNMLDKDKDKDKFYSKIRAPYERVFANQSKRVRYRGIAKNQFAAFMSAICFDLI